MVTNMTDEKKKVPIVCPRCNGTGCVIRIWHYYEVRPRPEATMCSQCLGTGEIGFTMRTQAEIDAKEHKHGP